VNKVATIEPCSVINMGTSYQALVIDKQGIFVLRILIIF
jgi:hypothetical protein